MSGGQFQLESEGFVCVELVVTHPNGSVSHLLQDFSPTCSVSKLKEDMVAMLAIQVEQQVWKHRGVTLKDDQTLNDVEVDADDIIEVSYKPAAD